MLTNLIKKSVQEIKCPTLIVFSKASSQKEKLAEITHKDLNKSLAEALAEKNISGKHGEVVLYREMNFQGYRHVAVVGLGPATEMNH